MNMHNFSVAFLLIDKKTTRKKKNCINDFLKIKRVEKRVCLKTTCCHNNPLDLKSSLVFYSPFNETTENGQYLMVLSLKTQICIVNFHNNLLLRRVIFRVTR